MRGRAETGGRGRLGRGLSLALVLCAALLAPGNALAALAQRPDCSAPPAPGVNWFMLRFGMVVAGSTVATLGALTEGRYTLAHWHTALGPVREIRHTGEANMGEHVKEGGTREPKALWVIKR